MINYYSGLHLHVEVYVADGDRKVAHSLFIHLLLLLLCDVGERAFVFVVDG